MPDPIFKKYSLSSGYICPRPTKKKKITKPPWLLPTHSILVGLWGPVYSLWLDPISIPALFSNSTRKGQISTTFKGLYKQKTAPGFFFFRFHGPE